MNVRPGGIDSENIGVDAVLVRVRTHNSDNKQQSNYISKTYVNNNT